MKRNILGLVAAAMLAAPFSATADTVDVITVTVNDDCTLEKYLAIVDDFNAYYKDRSYQTEILVPVHSADQDAVIWVGRSPSHTAFGQAYDHWEAERVKQGSKVSKLNARLEACTTTVSRSSFQTAK